MIDERDPVDDAETVLRRVPMRFFNDALSMPIARESFRPVEPNPAKGTPGDDGISVFREACGATPQMVIEAIQDKTKRDSFIVSRLEAKDLRRLGLTILPKPDSNGPPGHAIIPELSWQAYSKVARSWVWNWPNWQAEILCSSPNSGSSHPLHTAPILPCTAGPRPFKSSRYRNSNRRATMKRLIALALLFALSSPAPG